MMKKLNKPYILAWAWPIVLSTIHGVLGSTIFTLIMGKFADKVVNADTTEGQANAVLFFLLGFVGVFFHTLSGTLAKSPLNLKKIFLNDVVDVHVVNDSSDPIPTTQTETNNETP
jgi:uncharacterized membrane protein YeaQ/YmgE (transglycosylase-associated protein family)